MDATILHPPRGRCCPRGHGTKADQRSRKFEVNRATSGSRDRARWFPVSYLPVLPRRRTRAAQTSTPPPYSGNCCAPETAADALELARNVKSNLLVVSRL